MTILRTEVVGEDQDKVKGSGTTCPDSYHMQAGRGCGYRVCRTAAASLLLLLPADVATPGACDRVGGIRASGVVATSHCPFRVCGFRAPVR